MSDKDHNDMVNLLGPKKAKTVKKIDPSIAIIAKAKKKALQDKLKAVKKAAKKKKALQ